MRWPWQRKKESPEVGEARERLSHVEQDDIRINMVVRRTRRIVHDNHLAETIARALGAR